MNQPALFLAIVISLAQLTTADVVAQTSIVVNLGQFKSAQEAGHSEGACNWRDADTRDDTICTECFAALELQQYLRKITNDKNGFAIVDDGATPSGDLIVLGSPESNALTKRFASAIGLDTQNLGSLGDQGYRIKTGNSGGRRVTLIAGGRRIGTLYATYEFLHRVGCRWFGIGEVNEYVPSGLQAVDLDVTATPSYTVRGFRARYDIPKPSLDLLLWMARNRVNLWGVEAIEEPALAYKLGIKLAGGGHTATQLFLNPNSPYPYDHPGFKADNANPRDPYQSSEQFRGDANKDGQLSNFEAHPEWFALANGRRVPGLRKGQWGRNFCTSNEAATKKFVQNHVQALIDGIYKDADMIRLWTLDHGDWCQCDKCQAMGNDTDRYLRLVYDFDREIKKAQQSGRINRQVLVRFLIYGDVLNPPSRPLPDNFDYQTCVGTFFPIKRCYLHDFADETCVRNVPFQRQLYRWSNDPDRYYQGQLCIGEYYNLKRFANLPVCFMHTMRQDIPHYHQAGARHFHYMHSTTGNWGTRTLTNYQLARQTWNVEEDCPALWNDYFAKRYGPVGGTMQEFYESLAGMLSGVAELKQKDGLCVRLERGSKDLFPHPHLRYRREPGVECDGTTLVEMLQHSKRCRALIDQATAAELPANLQQRLAEDEGLFRYAELTLAYYHACVQAYQSVYSGNKDAARNHLTEARRVAELLRQDTKSTSAEHLSPHIAVDNAFQATLAMGVLERLAKLIDAKDSRAGGR